jgi:amino acid permease
MPPAAVVALEIPDVVMELKALNTVKERAEGIPQSAFTAPLEIVTWLTAFAMCIASLVQFARRSESKASLWLMAASVIVLLPITFLFLPLWQRVALDLALLLGFLVTNNSTSRIANLVARHA